MIRAKLSRILVEKVKITSLDSEVMLCGQRLFFIDHDKENSPV